MYAGLVGFIISAITLNKSLKNTDVPELITSTFGGSDLLVVNVFVSLSVALICYAISRLILSHYISTTPNPDVEGKFAILMIFTACSIAFAHGSNDVANACLLYTSPSPRDS